MLKFIIIILISVCYIDVQSQSSEVLVTNDAILMFDLTYNSSEIAVLNGLDIIDIYSKGRKIDSLDLLGSINDFKFCNKKNSKVLIVLSVVGISINNQKYYLSKFEKIEDKYKRTKQILLSGVFFNIRSQDNKLMLIGEDSLLFFDWNLNCVLRYKVSISSVLSESKNGLYVLDDDHLNLFFVSYKDSQKVELIYEGNIDTFPIAIFNNNIICRSLNKLLRISLLNNKVISEEILTQEYIVNRWKYNFVFGQLFFKNRNKLYVMKDNRKLEVKELNDTNCDFLQIKYIDGFLYYVDDFKLKRVKI